MLNFQLIVSKLLDLKYLFINMYGVKGQLSSTYFREIGSFFGFCYAILLILLILYNYVDIFSEPQKSFFTNKFRNCSISNEMSQKQ